MAKGIKLKQEEYVPAGNFLKTSFARDRAELLKRFSEFTTEYESGFETQLTKVGKLEQTLKLTEEQKGVTVSLYQASDLVNKEMNFLSFYFKRANLDSSLVSDVKKDLKNRNVEGATKKMEGLIQYIIEKSTVLESKGMATGFPEELSTSKTDLEAKNILQNKIMDIKGQLHEDNKAAYEKLYEYISTIANAGKIMYDGQGKTDEYTVTRLISRMRGGGGTLPKG
jgi:hypothetical protein